MVVRTIGRWISPILMDKVQGGKLARRKMVAVMVIVRVVLVCKIVMVGMVVMVGILESLLRSLAVIQVLTFFFQFNVITIILKSLEYLQRLLRMISGKSDRREFFLKKLNLNCFFPIFGQTERLANFAKIKKEVLDQALGPKIWLNGGRLVV